MGPIVLGTNNKTVYYDLTNKHCEVIAITKDRWSIKKSDEVPTMFRRYQTQQPQIYPTPPGQTYPPDIFDQFIDILNVKKDGNDRLLLACYIISLFIPKIAKAILMLHGPEGVAKSACEKLIKYLVDPCRTVLLPLRRKEDDLILQFVQNYLIYYDNVSEIPDWISDYFCMVATGFSFSKRMLYFDDEQIVFQLIRSIGFNGINLAANKADLLDRGLNIELEEIDPEVVLKFDDEILPKFNEIKPHLLSYIFDIVSKVLKIKAEGGIELRSRTRMADWEEYCEIIARCLGYNDMEFINAYRENRKTKTQVIIDETPVAEAVMRLMVVEKLKTVANGNGGGTWNHGLVVGEDLIWTGSPNQLLGVLKPIAADEMKIDVYKDELWPKAPHILSRRLDQVKSTLRGVGISINKSQNTKTKLRTIQIVKSGGVLSLEGGKVATPATPATPSDFHAQVTSDIGDATGDATDKRDATEKVATPKSDENHAQNTEGDARDARDATISNSTGKEKTEPTKPPPRPYSDFLVDGVPKWQIENRGMTEEEAEAFVRETERLKNDTTTGTRSKFDAMVEANLSGKGVMFGQDKPK